jgi:hypothetical protein
MGNFEFPRIIELTLHRKDRSIQIKNLMTTSNPEDAPSVPENPDISIIFDEFGSIKLRRF